MNASASALTREDEVQSKIRKVRKFGRYARVVCSAIFGFGLVAAVVMLLFTVLGPAPGAKGSINLMGPDGVTTAILNTPELKMWASLIGIVLTAVGLAAVYQLYRLFGNFAVGAIYTRENVRRVRNVGLLWLLSPVVGIALPLALAALGFIDGSDAIRHLMMPSTQSLTSFFAAGLILLASWIMDVGLYEKDHADALQRDADLVI